MMQKKRTFLVVVDCLKMGVKHGVFTIAIYGKIVRCSLKSFSSVYLAGHKCAKQLPYVEKQISENVMP